VTLHFHLLKDFFCFLNLATPDTTINKGIECHIVRSYGLLILLKGLKATLFHHLEDIQSTIKVLNSCKSFNQSCQYDGIHRDSIIYHTLINFNCLMNKVIFYTGIDKAAVSHIIGRETVLLHLLEGSEGLVYLIHLAESFNENAISHSRGVDLLLNHVLESSHCTIDILESHTCINKAII
jgi:hypothetical protein